MKRRSTFAASTATSVLVLFTLLGVAKAQPAATQPSIEFTRIPITDKGGTQTPLSPIEGRVVGGRPGQRIVLFARSGAWYIQPFVDQPFTELAPDSTWKNSTHLGTDYAALLVEPGYVPPSVTDVLPKPGGGVIAVANVPGTPFFWQTWWFKTLVVLACLIAILAFFRWRQLRMIREMNLRFEQRLAERTRIAQDLHDTLLQGLLSASMQLHVADDQLPPDSPAKPLVGRVLELMGQVIDDGRDAVRGLRAPSTDLHDLEQAFLRIRQELVHQEPVDYKVVVEGTLRPLQPVIRDEIYRIGREALLNAFRHARATRIEVEFEYTSKHLRILVRDNGVGIDSAVLQQGREGHWGLSGMRERALEIGGKLKVWSRADAGTEIEFVIPGHIAFETEGTSRTWFPLWVQRKSAAVRQQGKI